jgi:predicted PurR-regulated permease PerM
MMHIVIYSALVSAVASLVIGMLNLSRRRRLAKSGASATDLAGDQSQSLETPHPATPPPGTGRISQIDQPASTGRPSPMTAARDTDETALVMAAPTTQWSLPTKYVVGVGLFLALLFVVFFSRSVLSMIVLAALLAFVVQPVVKLFQRRLKMKRGSSVGLAYLLVVLALILIPLVVIPAIIQSINSVLSVDWETVGQDMALWLETAAQNVSSIPVIGSTLANTLETAAQLLSGASTLETPAPIVVDVSTTSLANQLAQTLGKLAKILGPLISAITSLVFMLLISLRMSLATDEIREAYPKLVPPSYKGEITDLVERIINVWVSFLRGQLSLMVVMGFLTYLLNLVLGTPYPVFLGFLAGLLEIIPNLGPVLATIPAMLFALVLGSSHLPVSNLVFAIIVILGYILLSGLENQVLVPKILGDAVQLHPLVVIIGCVVGGATFGLLGILISTPVISTGKEIFGYLYNKILEPPPKAESPEVKPSIMDTLKGFTGRFRLPFRRGEKVPSPDQPPASKIKEPMG